MKRRIIAFVLILVVLVTMPSTTYSCDENQCNTYVLQILFGDDAYNYESNTQVQMLLNALFLCSEQCDKQGIEKYNQLKSGGVMLPSFALIDVKKGELDYSSHCVWEKTQSNRKKVLQRTVNTVFDFGPFNNWFGSNSGKCNSFAALLYYIHILSDYLADDPNETNIYVGNLHVPSYEGEEHVELNNNIPSFSLTQKQMTNSIVQYSPLDSLDRAGAVFASIGPEMMSTEDRGRTQNPTGWRFSYYGGFIENGNLYNRSHLLAHQFGGSEQLENLITGTRYLNNSSMKRFEDTVAKYIKETGNHVLYRVTPVYRGNNLLASGVQMEAFSVEDKGAGICLNWYCYNVQPGIKINYATGANERSDDTGEMKYIIPLVVDNPNNFNPDLFYEISRYLWELLQNPDNPDGDRTLRDLRDQLNTIADSARSAGNKKESPTQAYINQKKYIYQYLDALKASLPLLLQKESFFTSAFSINENAA